TSRLLLGHTNLETQRILQGLLSHDNLRVHRRRRRLGNLGYNPDRRLECHLSPDVQQPKAPLHRQIRRKPSLRSHRQISASFRRRWCNHAHRSNHPVFPLLLLPWRHVPWQCAKGQSTVAQSARHGSSCRPEGSAPCSAASSVAPAVILESSGCACSGTTSTQWWEGSCPKPRSIGSPSSVRSPLT